LIRQGSPEYFYQTRDGKALVMGILFDEEGEMVTSGQLAQLHSNEGDKMFAMTGGVETLVPDNVVTGNNQNGSANVNSVVGNGTSIVSRPLTRAEEMFVDVRAANWVTIGPNGKNEIFAFLDPDCPHCQIFAEYLKPYVDSGQLKVRVLPVGIEPASERRAALMLAANNPLDRLIRYANGDATAMNAPDNIKIDAVQKNKSIMLNYKFDVTPIVIYRSGSGDIRIVRGRPNDLDAIIKDIQSK
jgi:protein-disulfide isomerase